MSGTDPATESEEEFCITPRQSSGSSDNGSHAVSSSSGHHQESSAGKGTAAQRRLRKKPFDFKLETEDTLLNDVSPKLKVTEENGFQPLMHKPTKRVQHFEENATGNKKRKTSCNKRGVLSTGIWMLCTGVAVGLLAKAVHILHDHFYKHKV